jgi:hypothetical protein
VLTENPKADRQELTETAKLLSYQLRRMSPEQAAFEFKASCLDDAQ